MIIKKLYDNNNFEELRKDKNGILFLKIRSITRKALLIEFSNYIGISNPQQQKSEKLIENIINNSKTRKKIDIFIKSKYIVERHSRIVVT